MPYAQVEDGRLPWWLDLWCIHCMTSLYVQKLSAYIGRYNVQLQEREREREREIARAHALKVWRTTPAPFGRNVLDERIRRDGGGEGGGW